jgi:hypothetical protein
VLHTHCQEHYVPRTYNSEKRENVIHGYDTWNWLYICSLTKIHTKLKRNADIIISIVIIIL